ncbi:MAG: amidohydrolase [Caulobacter sp.]|nr:amidohydrolase [Caulobacter sp.]
MASLNETILEPDLPIVDPHHHLWDRTALLAALPAPKHGFEHMLRRVPRYLFDDLLADMKRGHNVVATVYMECGAFYRASAEPAFKPVGEVEFVNGVAAQGASGVYGDVRPCAGIVGHADCTIGDGVAAVLVALMAAGNGRFRGIRQSCSADADPDVLGPLNRQKPGLYHSNAFREGFRHLGPLGLSFDAWLLEPQLPDLIDLARAFPDTQIILDHVGTPLGIGAYKGRRDERYPIWRDNIQTLAKLPNVSVKVGGLAMVFPGFDSFMSDPPTPSAALAEEWRPYVEPVIEAFGAERCMFESNFPVDIGSCDYDVLWNTFKVLAKGASAEEKTALFSGTATKVYRLDLT